MKIELPFEIGDRVWCVEEYINGGLAINEYVLVGCVIIKKDVFYYLAITIDSPTFKMSDDVVFPTREEAQAKCDELNGGK